MQVELMSNNKDQDQIKEESEESNSGVGHTKITATSGVISDVVHPTTIGSILLNFETNLQEKIDSYISDLKKNAKINARQSI